MTDTTVDESSGETPREGLPEIVESEYLGAEGTAEDTPLKTRVLLPFLVPLLSIAIVAVLVLNISGEEHAGDVEHQHRDDRDGEQRHQERQQHARLERGVLRSALGTEVLALDDLGESFAGSLARALVHGGVGHLLSPISVSSRSISSSPCRGVFARSSSEAHRKNTTAMIAHSRS